MGGSNLSHIEPCEVLFKDIPFYQEVKKVSAAHIFEYLSDMKSK